MEENIEDKAGETENTAAPELAAEQQLGLSDEFIRDVTLLLEEDDTAAIREKCAALSAPDAAELLTKVGPLRHRLADILEDDLAPESFSYLSYEILNDLFGNMSGPHIAAIVNELESDDAIHLIDELDETRRSEIMRHLSRRVRAVVEEGLNFPEESAGRLMQREFVAIPQFWTVGKTADYLRAASESLPDKFYDIFIVDPMHKYIGAVALSDVLCTQRSVKMESIVDENHVKIPVEMDQEQVAQIFRRKDLVSAPVIDDAGRLIGMITIDDIVDVIEQEASDDVLRLGGVTDSDIYSTLGGSIRLRFPWLFINLFNALLASRVVGFFEASIAEIVALAVLMPVVASMGGNSGTQAMTITVRALATRELTVANTFRVLTKECMVGLLNGAMLAVTIGLIATFWFSNTGLGLVISIAMLTTVTFGSVFGAFMPLLLTRLGFDPAPVAGVFLTTTTDVVGFFTFLGLATVFLL